MLHNHVNPKLSPQHGTLRDASYLGTNPDHPFECNWIDRNCVEACLSHQICS